MYIEQTIKFYTMITLKELRTAQNLDPSITVDQLLKKKKEGVSLLTQKTASLSKTRLAMKIENQTFASIYPKLKALFAGAGSISNIASIAKKNKARAKKNHFMTSVDKEAEKLRAEMKDSINADYHETSVDREKKQLMAEIQLSSVDLKEFETSVDREVRELISE